MSLRLVWAVSEVVSKLTSHDLDVLRAGARHPDGVIRPSRKSNFDRPERRMVKLVAAGLAEPSPHGDWYITDAGRNCLKAAP